MRQRSGPRRSASEKLVKDIQRATRKQYSAEETIKSLIGPRVSEYNNEVVFIKSYLDEILLEVSQNKEDITFVSSLMNDQSFMESLLEQLDNERLDMQSLSLVLAMQDGFEEKIINFDTADVEGYYSTSNPFVSSVPVPAALPFFDTGLALMGFMGWRRKRMMTT